MVGYTVEVVGERPLIAAIPGGARLVAASTVPRRLVIAALVGAAYYGAARLSLELALVGQSVTPLWLPTGVSVAAIIAWGLDVVPAISLAAFLVNLPITPSALGALGIAAGNTIAPLVAALVLQSLRFHRRLDRPADVLSLLVAALSGTTLSASLGTEMLDASHAIASSAFGSTWLVWWTGDTMGILLFAPFIWSVIDNWASWHSRRAVETLANWLLLSLLLILALHASTPLIFVVLPVLAWTAWRMQLAAAAPAVLLASVINTLAAVHRVGPYVHSSLVVTTVSLQTFNGVVAFTTLLITAAFAERTNALRESDRLSGRLSTLQELTAHLARLTSVADASAYVLGEAVDLLGGSTGSLCLVEGSELSLAASAGYPRSVLQAFSRFAIDESTPAGECVVKSQAIYCETIEELYERYPSFRDAPLVGDPSFAVLPLAANDGSTPFGAMVVGFATAQSFDDDAKSLLEALAQEASVALDRARANEAANRARAELEYIAAASKQLAASLDLAETMHAVARLAVPRLSDRCLLYLLADHEAIECFPLVPETRAGEQELLARAANANDSDVRRSLERAQPLLLAGRVDAAPFGSRPSTEGLLGEDIAGETLLVPLIAGGIRIGALALVDEQGRRISEDERRLAEELAVRAAVAIANARSYSNEALTAETLQFAILPKELPELRDIEIAARYLPAESGSRVGGDWYDVIMLDEQRFCFLIGDVSGHGLQAATTMASLRFATRAFVKDCSGPSDLLAKLTTMLDLRTDGHFATALCGFVDLAKRQMQVASAGHPPPVLRREGTARLAELEVAPPLGVSGWRQAPSALIDAAEWPWVLAFTDGLVEDRRVPIRTKLDLLVEVNAARHHAWPAETADELVGALVAQRIAESPDDDVAVLAMRWRS